MRNVKITIEYDGTGYSGWQIQNSLPWQLQLAGQGRQKTENRKQKKTIQETIEKALTKIVQEKVKLIGSGRTDAGVHARGQVANFKTKSKLPCKNIQNGLNSILPYDIRIRQVEDAPLNFHARFLGIRKLYRYTVVNDSYIAPHLYRYAYLVKFPLDVKKMRQAAKYFLGRHNFRSFQAVDKKERRSIRRILRLEIRKEKNIIHFDIEADGFLYRMARNIVGTIIEVGRGRLNPKEVATILKAKNRVCAGPCVPSKGLCLLEVKY